MNNHNMLYATFFISVTVGAGAVIIFLHLMFLLNQAFRTVERSEGAIQIHLKPE